MCVCVCVCVRAQRLGIYVTCFTFWIHHVTFSVSDAYQHHKHTRYMRIANITTSQQHHKHTRYMHIATCQCLFDRCRNNQERIYIVQNTHACARTCIQKLCLSVYFLTCTHTHAHTHVHMSYTHARIRNPTRAYLFTYSCIYMHTSCTSPSMA